MLRDALKEEREMNKKIITVTNYFDVWGNAKEGWEVNNCCHDEYEYRGKLESRKDCLKFLKKIDFLKKTVRIASIQWEETGRGWILDQASNGCPVCMVEITD